MVLQLFWPIFQDCLDLWWWEPCHQLSNYEEQLRILWGQRSCHSRVKRQKAYSINNSDVGYSLGSTPETLSLCHGTHGHTDFEFLAPTWSVFMPIMFTMRMMNRIQLFSICTAMQLWDDIRCWAMWMTCFAFHPTSRFTFFQSCNFWRETSLKISLWENVVTWLGLNWV